MQRNQAPAARAREFFGEMLFYTNYDWCLKWLEQVEPQRTMWLDRFYIARYAVIERQFSLFLKGIPADQIAGALELLPEDYQCEEAEYTRWRQAALIQDYDIVLDFCNKISGRLPTRSEWEKAGRGTDGQLYPWRNDWDEEAGFFYYEQKFPPMSRSMGAVRVDAAPKGVSPYGVWGLVGGLPELAIEDCDPRYVGDSKSQIIFVKQHPRHTSPDIALLHHAIPCPTHFDFPMYVGFRLARDQLAPESQWYIAQ